MFIPDGYWEAAATGVKLQFTESAEPQSAAFEETNSPRRAGSGFSKPVRRSNHTPSTTAKMPLLLESRMGRISWYSEELYHAIASWRVGNSMMTSRLYGNSPSITSRLPPRARNLPPYASIVAGAFARY